MSRGRKAYLQYEQQLSEAIARLARLREQLKAGIDADAESYNRVVAAYKQAKTAPDGGEALIDAALKGATLVPLETAQQAGEVAAVAESLRPVTNPNMASDLTVAVALAGAARTGALSNVEINLALIKDARFIADIRSKAGLLSV
jgi:glutamate formiminotransferase/formiminotetrahydrofolate cyclodeaminase